MKTERDLEVSKDVPYDPGSLVLILKSLFSERSHSGLVHRSRKPERLNGLRGFESHPLRQFLTG